MNLKISLEKKVKCCCEYFCDNIETALLSVEIEIEKLSSACERRDFLKIDEIHNNDRIDKALNDAIKLIDNQKIVQIWQERGKLLEHENFSGIIPEKEKEYFIVSMKKKNEMLLAAYGKKNFENFESISKELKKIFIKVMQYLHKDELEKTRNFVFSSVNYVENFYPDENLKRYCMLMKMELEKLSVAYKQEDAAEFRQIADEFNKIRLEFDEALERITAKENKDKEFEDF